MGDAIAEEAAIILAMLPLKILASKIMPRGKATTSFAILSSFQFLGMTVSRILGIIMTEAMGVRASKVTGCDFSMLPPLIAMCHQVFPTLVIGAAFLLVPRTIIKPE